MTPRPPESTQWLETIDDFIAGRLDSAAISEFQERLRCDEQARLVYIEYLDLHFELMQGAGGLASAESVARSVRAPRYGWLLATGAAAAVIVAVMWAVWPKRDVRQVAIGAEPAIAQPDSTVSVATSVPPVSVPIVARLERVAGAAWTDSDLTPDEGDELRNGDVLDFTGGSVEIRFDSGAHASLVASEGRTARLRVGANSCRFESGCAMFSVPPGARGFAVETIGGTFIDHGTEFGVSADPRGASQAHVIDGLVEAFTRSPSAPVLLRRGTAVALDGRGEAAVPIAFNSDAFLLPATLAWGIERYSQGIRPCLIPPPSLDRGAALSADVTHLVLEQRGFVMSAAWENQPSNITDLVHSQKTRVQPFSVPAGTVVDSYLFHATPSAKSRRDLAGEIRFRRPILAVVTDTDELRRARDVFRNPQVQYDDSIGFGLESVVGGAANDRVDVIELADNRHTLRFALNVGSAVDEFRVLVAAGDDSPPHVDKRGAESNQ